MQQLTWSLVVPTFNRLEILREALKCVVAQTRPPIEIIVVDSSPDSKTNELIVTTEFAGYSVPIDLVYILSSDISITIQRNTGIDRCNGAIVCFIDDDTFIEPDFAERILEVYEQDCNAQIAGIQGFLTDKPHLAELTRFQVVHPVKQSGSDHIFHFLKATGLYINWGYFLPYKGKYPDQTRIPCIEAFDVQPTRTLGGGFPTYRREIIQTVRYDQDLLFYATGEDQDASYRASHLGAVLQVNTAKAYHCAFPSGARLDPFLRVLTMHTNIAFWVQKHNPRSLYIKLCFFILLCWHVPCRLLDDLQERRWTLPRVRALLAAIRHGIHIFFIPAPQLANWYRGFQRRLFEQRQ